MTYRVLVDDNFHYQDERERYAAGEFKTCEQAVARCRKIVDRSLRDLFKAGMTAEELFRQYTLFGEDPWISADTGDVEFSARTYAQEKCAEICSGGR